MKLTLFSALGHPGCLYPDYDGYVTTRQGISLSKV